MTTHRASRRSFAPHAGAITLLVVIFGAIFLAVLASLSGYLLSQSRLQALTRVRTEALSIAEAGLDYYHWHLAHFPTDFANGTGSPGGSYPVVIPDPQGGTAGTATLTITPNTSCHQTLSVDIASSGASAEDPSHPVTVVARYAEPSIAAYNVVTNNSIWFGSSETLNGPVHANNGIHEDGPNNAPVTSAVSSWTCPSFLGCHGETEPGVFGNGSNPSLWQFPVPNVDFTAIASDFSADKSVAQAYGIYLPRYSTGSQPQSTAYHKGYHLVFHAPDASYPNGSVTVTKVNPGKVNNVYLLDTSKYATEYSLISGETSSHTYTLPSDCGLIFVEDNAWIEGTIPGKVTVIAANPDTPGIAPDVFIRGNITYVSADGSDGLTVIAQHDVLIAPDAPYNLTINGIFVAQTGSFGRNGYWNSTTFCNGTYEPRGAFTLHGTIVASLYESETWVIGHPCGTEPNAGYQTTNNSPDRTLATDPPPFTPITSSQWDFVDWRQEN